MEEYEKKLASMKEIIKNLKGVDKKARDKALKAFKEGDYSKAKQLFAELDEKAKKRQEVSRMTSRVVFFSKMRYYKIRCAGPNTHYMWTFLQPIKH